MAEATITSKDGDMIDFLVWKHYGKQSSYVEAVLDSAKNWRLSYQPEELNAGTKVVMPQVEPVEPTINLFGD